MKTARTRSTVIVIAFMIALLCVTGFEVTRSWSSWRTIDGTKISYRYAWDPEPYKDGRRQWTVELRNDYDYEVRFGYRVSVTQRDSATTLMPGDKGVDGIGGSVPDQGANAEIQVKVWNIHSPNVTLNETKTAENIGLQGYALDAARHVRQRFPGVVFTSGHRDLNEQIRAMATNIYEKQDKNWISKVYKKSNSFAQQTLNSAIVTKWDKIHNSIDEIIKVLTEEFDNDKVNANKISYHLLGLAFDIRADSVDKNALFQYVRSQPGYMWSTDNESGLKRWHFQFYDNPNDSSDLPASPMR